MNSTISKLDSVGRVRDAARRRKRNNFDVGLQSADHNSIRKAAALLSRLDFR